MQNHRKSRPKKMRRQPSKRLMKMKAKSLLRKSAQQALFNPSIKSCTLILTILWMLGKAIRVHLRQHSSRKANQSYLSLWLWQSMRSFAKVWREPSLTSTIAHWFSQSMGCTIWTWTSNTCAIVSKVRPNLTKLRRLWPSNCLLSVWPTTVRESLTNIGRSTSIRRSKGKKSTSS